MAKQLPAGFDPARVIAGLHKAMEFGEPSRSADKATFYKVLSTTGDGTLQDEDGVPFDPNIDRTVKPTPIQVPCAVEYIDRTDQAHSFGSITASRVEITLLDPDYQKVKGFSYVVCGGDKYVYRLTEPGVALGSIDVWTVHAVAEDES